MSLPLPPLFAAWRQTLRAGYSWRALRGDLGAGHTVGIIAIPLAMALAIAVGVPPQHGLYTVLVAGSLIALFGGSRFNVSGPTAAFVVILLPITQQFGLGGLLLCTLMAGLILIALGLMRAGRLIEFIPYPVTLGFTAGIGIVIATLQFKDLLGLSLAGQPSNYIEQLQGLWLALPWVGGLLPATAPQWLRTTVEFVAGQDRPWAYWLLFSIHIADDLVRTGFLIFLPFLLRDKGADLPTIGLGLSLLFAGGAAGKLVMGWVGQKLGVVPSVLLTETATTLLILAVLPLPLVVNIALQILLALETAHAIAQVMKLAPTMGKDQSIVLCMSGRGDKDVESVGRYLGLIE